MIFNKLILHHKYARIDKYIAIINGHILQYTYFMERLVKLSTVHLISDSGLMTSAFGDPPEQV
jgi:hypothetical protein